MWIPRFGGHVPHFVENGCVNDAGLDDRHSDVEGLHFLGEDFTEGFQRELGGRQAPVEASAIRPAMEVTLMRQPWRCARIVGKTACMHRTAPK